MIKISILDETYFRDYKLNGHWRDHVQSTKDGELRMDEMDEKVYDEIGNQLSLAKCSPVSEEFDDIIGYMGEDGLYRKHDKFSKIMVSYNYKEDYTVTEFRVERSYFLELAKKGSTNHKEYKRLCDIPQKDVGTGSFDYFDLKEKYNIKERTDYAYAPPEIDAVIMDLEPDVVESLRNKYSKNKLKKGSNNKLLIDDFSNMSVTNDNIKKMSKEQSLTGMKVPFKIVGYGHDENMEAIKIEFQKNGMPSIIKQTIDRYKIKNLFNVIILSRSNTKINKSYAPNLDFEEVDDNTIYEYTVGLIVKKTGQVVFNNIKPHEMSDIEKELSKLKFD